MRFSKRFIPHMGFMAAIVLLTSAGSWASVNHKWSFVGGTKSQILGITEDSVSSSSHYGWDCGTRVDQLCVVFVQNGAWAAHDSVDLRCGLTGFNMKVGNNNGATVKVCLDSLNATPVCTLAVPRATASDYLVYSAAVQGQTPAGVHKVYVKWSGSGFLGNYIWNEFVTNCPQETDRIGNWMSSAVPASGDSVDFSGGPANPKDTVQWNLNIALAHLNLNAGRSVAIVFDALQRLGIDTLQVGSMDLRLGHLKVPAGFVILTQSADTNGAVLAPGAYTALTCRAGLTTNFTLSGGGTLVVGPYVGIRDGHMRSGAAVGPTALSVHDNWLSIGTQPVSRMGLFDVKGKQVRSVSMAHAISTANLPAGAYLLRAVAGRHTQEYRVIVGK